MPGSTVKMQLARDRANVVEHLNPLWYMSLAASPNQ
jgi:hypothetical protein